jgi:MFS family permease
MGGGVDGVFAVSITLILAQDHSVSVAVLSGGALLALRHLTEAVAAPLFGKVADRYGARRVFVAMMLLTAVGFAGIGLGATVPGALLMLSARGALATLGPALIVEEAGRTDVVMAPLARLQAWRDLGAAIGPLATGYALLVVSPQSLHGLLALLMAGTLARWAQSRYRRREAAA